MAQDLQKLVLDYLSADENGSHTYLLDLIQFYDDLKPAELSADPYATQEQVSALFVASLDQINLQCNSYTKALDQCAKADVDSLTDLQQLNATAILTELKNFLHKKMVKQVGIEFPALGNFDEMRQIERQVLLLEASNQAVEPENYARLTAAVKELSLDNIDYAEMVVLPFLEKNTQFLNEIINSQEKSKLFYQKYFASPQIKIEFNKNQYSIDMAALFLLAQHKINIPDNFSKIKTVFNEISVDHQLPDYFLQFLKFDKASLEHLLNIDEATIRTRFYKQLVSKLKIPDQFSNPERYLKDISDVTKNLYDQKRLIGHEQRLSAARIITPIYSPHISLAKAYEELAKAEINLKDQLDAVAEGSDDQMMREGASSCSALVSQTVKMVRGTSITSEQKCQEIKSCESKLIKGNVFSGSVLSAIKRFLKAALIVVACTAAGALVGAVAGNLPGAIMGAGFGFTMGMTLWGSGRLRTDRASDASKEKSDLINMSTLSSL